MRRAAVVGFGAITPLGDTAEATWQALLAGQNGVRSISRFNAQSYPVQFAAQVTLNLDGTDLYDALIDSALSEAMEAVDLSEVPSDRVGVFMGCEAARPQFEGLARQVLAGATPEAADVLAHMPNRPAIRVAKRVAATGPVVTLSTACTSSGQAVGEALLAIRRGEVDVAIAGGVDALVHPLMVTGFARLGALSTRNDAPDHASRPFDNERDGFVLGEGAGVIVLASSRVAESIGSILGWVSGYGCSCNAWRITDSPPDGRGAAQAMEAALADGGFSAEDVAYINAHGTSTKQNDISEARGIQTVLGDCVNSVPVSSTKSMMGHLVAACGAVEAIVCLQAVRDGVAPITRNLEHPDPECTLRHIMGAPATLKPGVALTNAFGFGGSNASLVLEAP